MEWALLLVVLYIPIFYRIHHRLRVLEDKVREQGEEIIRLSGQNRVG
ncbi:MAG TPA: hypothetical protein VFV52_03345 [Bacilli bacterium]|nr:hypothetical protein [Bacilli bacterium]